MAPQLAADHYSPRLIERVNLKQALCQVESHGDEMMLHGMAPLDVAL